MDNQIADIGDNHPEDGANECQPKRQGHELKAIQFHDLKVAARGRNRHCAGVGFFVPATEVTANPSFEVVLEMVSAQPPLGNLDQLWTFVIKLG